LEQVSVEYVAFRKFIFNTKFKSPIAYLIEVDRLADMISKCHA